MASLLFFRNSWHACRQKIGLVKRGEGRGERGEEKKERKKERKKAERSVMVCMPVK